MKDGGRYLPVPDGRPPASLSLSLPPPIHSCGMTLLAPDSHSQPPLPPPHSLIQAMIKPRADGKRIVEGKCFVVGDNIDTDQIIPAEVRYCPHRYAHIPFYRIRALT